MILSALSIINVPFKQNLIVIGKISQLEPTCLAWFARSRQMSEPEEPVPRIRTVLSVKALGSR